MKKNAGVTHRPKTQRSTSPGFGARLRTAYGVLRGQAPEEPEVEVEIEPENKPKTTRGGSFLRDDDVDVNSSGPIDAFSRRAAGLSEEGGKDPKSRVMSFAEKHNWRWLGRLMQILNRFSELQGGNVASAVTLQVFLSFFPMLIIASSIAGFFIRNSETDVTSEIIKSLGITDPNMQTTISNAMNSASEGAGLAAVIGFVALLWSALGVSSALQFAYNQCWQSSGRGIKDKAVGLGWMAGAGVIMVAVAASAVVVGWLPAWAGVLSSLLSVALTFGLWIFTSLVLPNVKLSWRHVVPGALIATAGMEVIKQLARLIPGAVGGAESGAYGAFGAALALIAALFIFGKLVVYSAVANVVLYEGKHGTTTATIEVPTVAVESVVKKDNEDEGSESGHGHVGRRG